jgi:hypothetical protein
MKFCTAAGEMLNVGESMSQNTGRAPVRAIVPAVAKNVKGDVTTSSPAHISSAISASNSASVPEETPIPKVAAQYRAISASRAVTWSPRMKR